MESKSTSSRTIQAVDTTFELLEEILERDGAGVTELADALGTSKSTVHHHLATLEKHHFVTNDGGEYALGLGSLIYGGHARESHDLYEAARDDVDKLARTTGETARLVVEHAGYGLTVYQSTGQKVEDPPTHVGTMEHLHSTAAGKAFLAALPRRDVDDIVDRRGLEAFTPSTITDREELFDELERIRADGLAFDESEQFDGTRCLATTFTADSGDLLGAISISAPAERMGDHRFRTELPQRLKNLCEVVEQVDDYQVRSQIPCISRTLPL